MLRGLVVALAAANALFFAWGQGWLGDLGGLSPLGDREPQRLDHQINPGNLRVLPPEGTPGPSAAPATTGAADGAVETVCLEAGPYTAEELAQAEAIARATLPSGSWTVTRRERPGLWLVYMGRFADRDQLRRKVAELKRQDIRVEEIEAGAAMAQLAPGLAFGRFTRLDDAQSRLRKLENQRVREVRIVTLEAPAMTAALRIRRDTDEARSATARLGTTLGGKALVACDRA